MDRFLITDKEYQDDPEKLKLKHEADSVLTSCTGQRYRHLQRDVKSFLRGELQSTSCTTEQEADTANILDEDVKSISESQQKRLDVIVKLVARYNVLPKAEDFNNDPISLTNDVTIPPESQRTPAPIRELIAERIRIKEQEANHMLHEYKKKFGDHPLLKAAFRQYYAR